MEGSLQQIVFFLAQLPQMLEKRRWCLVYLELAFLQLKNRG
jgi:hypothetical protein